MNTEPSIKLVVTQKPTLQKSLLTRLKKRLRHISNTAILLNKITLLAVVGGNEVTNPFMVTEVYIKEKKKWTLGSLSFTKLLTP
jgi:hypothetical protein